MNDLKKTSTIHKLPAKLSYDYKFKHELITIEFDKRYLYQKWSSRISKGSKAYLLHDLSPKLTTSYHIGEKSLSTLRWACTLLLLAVIVFFSEYQVKIPLLAPSAAGLGILLLIKGIFDFLPRSWSILYDDDDILIIPMLIDKNETSQRQTQRLLFEQRLSEAIENAKQQEYYNLD